MIFIHITTIVTAISAGSAARRCPAAGPPPGELREPEFFGMLSIICIYIYIYIISSLNSFKYNILEIIVRFVKFLPGCGPASEAASRARRFVLFIDQMYIARRFVFCSHGVDF